jgi:hypothetical protein
MYLKRILLVGTLCLSTSACMQPTVSNQVQVNVVAPKTKPASQTLSVLRIVDGDGCPDRDPKSFGVFLKSERQAEVLICYYD